MGGSYLSEFRFTIQGERRCILGPPGHDGKTVLVGGHKVVNLGKSSPWQKDSRVLYSYTKPEPIRFSFTRSRNEWGVIGPKGHEGMTVMVRRRHDGSTRVKLGVVWEIRRSRAVYSIAEKSSEATKNQIGYIESMADQLEACSQFTPPDTMYIRKEYAQAEQMNPQEIAAGTRARIRRGIMFHEAGDLIEELQYYVSMIPGTGKRKKSDYRRPVPEPETTRD